MKAIHINAEKQTITEININGLSGMQDAVGGYIAVAHGPNDKNTIYVDDEGLLKGYNYGFEYNGAHQPFAGNGIVCGIDYETGESTDCTLTIDEIKKNVRFFITIPINVG